MTENRRHDLLAVAVLLALPTLLFADVLLGAGNFAMRDLTRYYYPTKQIYRQIVAGGEFPLWNPFFHGGQPLAANPEHEIFYPFTWLLLLPSFDLGYRLHILVHVYIALLGTYALLRSMEIRAPASVFGAVSFGLGGLFLSYVNLLPILFCAAWLPLTFLFTRRFLMGRRGADFALASLFLGLQFLVAEPTTIVQTGLLLGLYALYCGWTAAKDRNLGAATAGAVRATGGVALISGAAFALGAVQMLPAIDHAANSARARPFAFEVVSAWSMPWPKLAELVYPNVLGHVQLGGEIRYWGSQLYETMNAPFVFSIYPGLAVMALLAAGIVTRISGSRFVIVVAALSVLLAAGDRTPLLRLLYDLGVATAVRYPEKFLLMGVFVGTLFAAYALDRLLEGDERVRQAAAGFAAATALLAGLLLVLSMSDAGATGWRTFFDLLPGEDSEAHLALARFGWAVASLRGLLLFLLIAGLDSARRRLWVIGAALFLCADLLPVVHQLNPRLPRRFFEQAPPVVRTLDPNRTDYRVFHEADWFGGDRIGLLFPESSARYWIARNGLFPATPAGHGIRTVMDRDYDETALLPTVDFTAAMWEVRRSGRPDWQRPFMAMSNAWYRAVLADQPLAEGGRFESASPVRFLKGPPHPRYYFADQIVEAGSREQFVEKLSSGRFSDRVAFVDSTPWDPAPAVMLHARERANGATIHAESKGRALLVMSVTANKHWRVTVNGRPVQPLTANLAYQAVELPAGHHTVTMRYRNRMVEIGAVTSLLAIGALAAIFVVSTRRRARGNA